MALRSRQYPTLAEAAQDWYRNVYLPLIERIRESAIVKHFPGRTEADLYLWIAENRAQLQMQYGHREEVKEAVEGFAKDHRIPALSRWLRKLCHSFLPRPVPPEQWSPDGARIQA